jgi:DNA-directed RNA polymerase subunit F
MNTKTMTMQEFYDQYEKSDNDEIEKFRLELQKEGTKEKIVEKLNNLSPDSPAWTGWW